MPDGEEVIGIFLGLQSSSYEYIANIIAPYKANFSIELGSFLLIYDEPFKLVARVIDFIPQGELVSFMGQKWLSDVAFDSEAIGADIKKRKISYSVKIKILGSLDSNNKFIAGLRKIPHITSKVVKPTSTIVTEIINQVLDEQKRGSDIGGYFLDEKIRVKFDLNELLPKRTFIFARAGYGKSNLMKVLSSEWKEGFGSLVIFDPDGEYAFTDKKKRPGIMDKRESILITNRQEKQDVKNVYRNLKFNLKEFDPQFIVPIIVPPEKYENIFFQKLMGLEHQHQKWCDLVDLIFRNGWNSTSEDIANIVSPTDSPTSVVIAAIRNNLVYPIRTLHDPQSHLMTIIEKAIRKESIIIMDISRVNSKTSLWISSIIVKHILNQNQKNFISGSPKELLNATFAIDEAQSVLSKDSNVEAFVELAKEGRKYSLGSIFITQQPSSIPFEILSQGDNFFVFHLLSKGDLVALQNANAHYSNDIVTQALNEPKKGKSYMWTSSQPFVLPVQINNFEDADIVDKAKSVQDKSKLLSSILEETNTELKNPIFKSILKKYSDVEREHAEEDIKVKTTTLFQKLNEDEKEFLKQKKALQQNVGREGFFAVTYRYYSDLATMIHSLVEE